MFVTVVTVRNASTFPLKAVASLAHVSFYVYNKILCGTCKTVKEAKQSKHDGKKLLVKTNF